MIINFHNEDWEYLKISNESKMKLEVSFVFIHFNLICSSIIFSNTLVMKGILLPNVRSKIM